MGDLHSKTISFTVSSFDKQSGSDKTCLINSMEQLEQRESVHIHYISVTFTFILHFFFFCCSFIIGPPLHHLGKICAMLPFSLQFFPHNS